MPRERTPPGLKWALNQRALLSGRADKLAARVAELQVQLHSTLADMAALDATIALLDSRARPDALGSIHGWAGTYGKRGDILRFIQEVLRSVGSGGLDTGTLGRTVIDHFGLEFESVDLRNKFINGTVRSALRRLEARGLAERVGENAPRHLPRVWRWKEGPTLEDLARLSGAAS